MYSVNIDKLVKMTDQEKECYENAVQSIDDQQPDKLQCLATVGNGRIAFKLADTFSKSGKHVLFLDADLNEEVFLGKYRLGKNLTGFADFIRRDMNQEPLIIDDKVLCYTNNKNLNIIFTGETKATTDLMLTSDKVNKLLSQLKKQFDLIVVHSDSKGKVAKYCDATVLLLDLDMYSEISAEVMASELDKEGCNVLGVIINE